jgi:uncharacterized membrane protein
MRQAPELLYIPCVAFIFAGLLALNQYAPLGITSVTM